MGAVGLTGGCHLFAMFASNKMVSVIEPDCRGKGMECRYYRNWLGRQLLLLRRLLLVCVVVLFVMMREGSC